MNLNLNCTTFKRPQLLVIVLLFVWWFVITKRSLVGKLKTVITLSLLQLANL
jgi:hypothetical protein